MATIYRDNAKRVTVADAKRLILDANPDKGVVSIVAEVDEHGDATGSIHVEHKVPIESDFLEICSGLGIRPRMQHSPAVMAYRGTTGQDNIYTIAHDEFAAIAEVFNVLVDVGVAPEQDSKTPAPVWADELNFALLVTRKELIDVYGKFTGMDKAWFDNLNTSPKLKAARKFTGQGGRHSAEPLFCPYEVMQWLIDPKRKKGKSLTADTAWRLLKNNFGKVYNQFLIGDPNAD